MNRYFIFSWIVLASLGMPATASASSMVMIPEGPFTMGQGKKAPHGPERRLFGEAGAIAPAYRTRFEAHRGMLSDIATRLGWTFIAHRTDRPPQAALLALYAALGGLKDRTQ